MKRNLDGVYFRVKRDGKWDDVCFSDLTKEEREQICKGRSLGWMTSLVFILADTIKNIGEQLDIVCE